MNSPCYNAQAVVDERAQVIIATTLVQHATDVNQLTPMIETTTEQLGRAGVTDSPRVLLADAGYCSADNLQDSAAVPTEVLIATGRQKHGERITDAPRGRIPKDATPRERMARRLRTKDGRGHYARRKAIVEPVFGQMKTRQRAGQLRLRGLEGAQGEWTLHALCHNLRKLANASSIGASPPHSERKSPSQIENASRHSTSKTIFSTHGDFRVRSDLRARLKNRF